MSSEPPANPCLIWETERHVAALISLRGERHRRQRAPNQDASLGCGGHVRGLPYIALALADGHGGKDYPNSDRGAQLAVTAFGEMAAEFAHYVAELIESNQGDWRREASRHFRDKCGQRLLQIWQAKVDTHAQSAQDPAAADEVARRRYGTTVVGLVLTHDLILAGGIGDSRTYRLQQTNTALQVQPLTETLEGLGLATPSLVSPAAHRYWQTAAASDEETVALVLATDGFADSFADRGEAVILDLVEKTRRNGLRWLRERLPSAADVWNREGVADDLTLILCIRSDLIEDIGTSPSVADSAQAVYRDAVDPSVPPTAESHQVAAEVIDIQASDGDGTVSLASNPHTANPSAHAPQRV
ncbi:protein phosphatase 2C domain-containing protein [Caldichromatium japonicum]|uniref:Protein phosphatase 2C domain-containing protein n=1 Tax=Caldichromatium japonicum TaxID=2699430 RepID=A0A6G7VD51_9GAMM|nr:protein phosphatase 2C domain-containing protein [Caldichromatium japonicum]QIK37717.1 protein phosphatase 2C domain-containing protein [Caldichromatium japonicum]